MNRLKSRTFLPLVITVVTLSLLLIPILLQTKAMASEFSSSGAEWCSDYAGNNFLSGKGGGSSSSSGGNTATKYESEVEIGRSNSSDLLGAGNRAWNNDNYENAADLYYNAVVDNSDNPTLGDNLSESLNKLGLQVYYIEHYASAWLYFSRAVDRVPANRVKAFKGNADAAAFYVSDHPDCGRCGKAIISDVGYELDNSALLISYAGLASRDYENCTQHISKSCKGSAGKSFYDQLQYCFNNFYTLVVAMRGRIRQAWKDAS